MRSQRFLFAKEPGALQGFKFPMFEKAGRLIADLGGKYGWTLISTDANETETLSDGRKVDVAYRNLLDRVRLALSLRWRLGGEENAGTETLFESVR